MVHNDTPYTSAAIAALGNFLPSMLQARRHHNAGMARCWYTSLVLTAASVSFPSIRNLTLHLAVR